MSSPLELLARKILTPYAERKPKRKSDTADDGNGNTGNVYEIMFALWVLRKMGLTDADMLSLRRFFDIIRNFNPKFTLALEADIRALPVGTGFFLEGQRVVDIRNVTQDDGDGGTGDFVFILANGSERSISVKEGAPQRGGKIKMCLTNPTCRRLGCSETMVEEFKAIAARAVEEFKAEMTARYGANQDAWPARVKSAAQKTAVAAVATKTRDNFNALPPEQQRALLADLLCVSKSEKPADYLALVKKDKWTVSMWQWVNLKIDVAQYNLTVRGDYLVFTHRATGAEIGQTQVKFNNGVYKKNKRTGKWETSSLTSSWNGGFCITDCFTMAAV